MPVGRGRHACKSLEESGKVGDILKSGFKGYIANRHLFFCQKFRGVHKSVFIDKLGKCFACSLFKIPTE